VWSHIDDILFAHHSEHLVWLVSQFFQDLFNQVEWKLNTKKSVLIPKTRVKFLGAYWGPEGVKRSRKVSAILSQLTIAILHVKLAGKPLQRIRGFFNYYLAFAGLYFSLINRILLLKDKSKFCKIIFFLIKQDFIHFNNIVPNTIIHIFSDAKPFKCAVYLNGHTEAKTSFRPILINELLAATMALKVVKKLNVAHPRVFMYIDNKAVVSFINKGRCHWTKDFSILTHFNYLKFFHEAKKWSSFTAIFVPSAANLADAPSRAQAWTYPG
jgi:hypothetical protein